MAIAVTSLGSLGDTANISTYTCTLARAPAANALLIATVQATDLAGTPVEPTSVRGADFIFSLITSSITYNPVTVGSQIFNISHWRSMRPTAPSGTTVGATFPNAATGCCILVTEFTGVDTSGTSGSGAIGSSANSLWEGQSSLTLMGPAAGNANNAWYSGMGIGVGQVANDLDTPDGNYTDLDQANYTTPAAGAHSAWTTLSTGTLMRWSGSGSQQRAGCLIEIVAAAVVGGAVVDTWAMRQLYQGAFFQ